MAGTPAVMVDVLGDISGLHFRDSRSATACVSFLNALVRGVLFGADAVALMSLVMSVVLSAE